MRRHRDPNKLYPHDHAMRWLVLPLIPRWVTPNHVTVSRFLMTPFAVWGLAIGAWAWAIPFFIFVAFTDVIDGSLARVRKQVTEWGSFYDPLADKLLISLAAVVVITQAVGWWLTILLLFFEVAIVAGALRYKHDGGIVMANAWGKTKMFLQSTGVVALVCALAFSLPLLTTLGTIILILAIFFAIMSLVTYGI